MINPNIKTTIAIIIPVLISVSSIVVYSLGFKKTKAASVLVQQLQSKQQSNIDEQDIVRFVKTKPQEAMKVDVSLPNETNIVSVLEDIEKEVRSVDSAGIVNINNQTPIKIGADLTLNLTARVATSSEGILNLLAKLNAMPYML